MKIFAICVNEESGKYLALSDDEGFESAVSATSAEAAVGMFVAANPGCTVKAVVYVDWRLIEANQRRIAGAA